MLKIGHIDESYRIPQTPPGEILCEILAVRTGPQHHGAGCVQVVILLLMETREVGPGRRHSAVGSRRDCIGKKQALICRLSGKHG